MNKAAKLAAQLEQVDGDRGLQMIEAQTRSALHFDVIDGVMCIMHSDGSVNMIGQRSSSAMMVETISAANILKVLQHYRPFGDVFPGMLQ
jgi:hypothetical protein